MKLSIIIPTYNEGGTITEILERISDARLPSDWKKEIIIIDDGSRQPLKLKNHKIIRHEKNQGKGAAIKTALKYAEGDYILTQDADLEYDPSDYKKLLQAIDYKTPVVYGSRNIGSTNKGYLHYVLGAKILTSFINVLFGSKLTDSYTCYKLIPSSLIKSLDIKSNGFEIEAEITAKILKKKFPIKEVAISYNPRKFKEGKKIRFKDGLKGLWTILKYRIQS